MFNAAHCDRGHHPRKGILVALSLWAITSGRSWLVRAVEVALHRGELSHA